VLKPLRGQTGPVINLPLESEPAGRNATLPTGGLFCNRFFGQPLQLQAGSGWDGQGGRL